VFAKLKNTTDAPLCGLSADVGARNKFQAPTSSFNEADHFKTAKIKAEK